MKRERVRKNRFFQIAKKGNKCVKARGIKRKPKYKLTHIILKRTKQRTIVLKRLPKDDARGLPKNGARGRHFLGRGTTADKGEDLQVQGERKGELRRDV